MRKSKTSGQDRHDILGNCTDHRSLYAQGLVDQFAHSTCWELYRPPIIICSGTGRPVRLFNLLGTEPTIDHYMLGDWSTSSPIRLVGNCTDHRSLYARGLVDQFAYSTCWELNRPSIIICSGTGRPVRPFDLLGTEPTTDHYMLGDWSTSSPT